MSRHDWTQIFMVLVLVVFFLGGWLLMMHQDCASMRHMPVSSVPLRCIEQFSGRGR